MSNVFCTGLKGECVRVERRQGILIYFILDWRDIR